MIDCVLRAGERLLQHDTSDTQYSLQFLQFIHLSAAERTEVN